MGGTGSGRKPGSKNKEKVIDFRPAKEQKEPKGRVYSVPAHVRAIRTPGGVRFEG